MGSVKYLIQDNSEAGKLYRPPTQKEFGLGAWQVTGNFSVKDLKEQIPESSIRYKPEALAMTNAAFFEYLAKTHPEIKTCYRGLLDVDGKIVDTQKLLQKGQTSSIVVMKLAHTPKSYSNGNLAQYRNALISGELECGVADVESIFRKGFPLGSSTFGKIFEKAGLKDEYEKLATYEQVVKDLDKIREKATKVGLSAFNGLEKILQMSGLKKAIPNPGYVLKKTIYNSTTKFEEAGDRDLSPEEEKKLSGLDNEGYEAWTKSIFPKMAEVQMEFTKERGILSMDGKCECVAYRRKPVVTDFACTVDENRLMIAFNHNDSVWAIPSNKEIQRAIFKQAGIDTAISEAKRRAENKGDINQWKNYIPQVTAEMEINLKAVAEHSCNLMSYAMAEVANRTLDKNIFNVPPLTSWIIDFLPYASKIEYQQ